MSKVDITIKEKNGEIDGEYKFDLDADTIQGLKNYIVSKFTNFKPVRLSFEGKELNNDYTLKDVHLVTGDTIEYEIINSGGRRTRRRVRKSKKSRKSNKSKKSRKSRKSKHRHTKKR